MNYSAVLVTCRLGGLDSAIKAVKEGFEGVEVHQIDEPHSRFIAVLEAPDTEAEINLFKKFSQIPSVVDTALVVHHFEDEAVINPMVGSDPLK